MKLFNRIHNIKKLLLLSFFLKTGKIKYEFINDFSKYLHMSELQLKLPWDHLSNECTC